MSKIGLTHKVLLELNDEDGQAITTARIDFANDGKPIPGYPDEKGKLELSLPLRNLENNRKRKRQGRSGNYA